jgi:hypothetical protein
MLKVGFMLPAPRQLHVVLDRFEELEEKVPVGS